MRSKSWQKEAPVAACCLLAFCIPLPFIFATLSIWLLIICWLISLNYRSTWRNLVHSQAFWLWTIYFAMHAVSYIWSVDKWQSQFDTVGKLSFVLLPLLIGAGTTIDVRRGSWILIAFVAGIIITGFYCLDQANTRWQEDGNLNHFIYHELTRGLDATAVYMAWYVGGAQAALLLYPWREAGQRWMIWWRWLVMLFLSGFLLLLASRLMIVSLILLVIPAYSLRQLTRYRRFLFIPIVAVLLAFGTLIILAQTRNPVRTRFADIMHPDISTVTRENYQGKEPVWTNLTLRLFVWRIAIENMNAHHLWLHGAGNGDIHRIQNERIASHGIPGMTEESKPRSFLYKVNMHNMYLQSLISFGIPGAIIFILIAFGPLFYLKRSNAPWFFGVFHIICIMFMVEESALQTQAGVIYYCFFYSMFMSGVKSHVKRGEISEKTYSIER